MFRVKSKDNTMNLIKKTIVSGLLTDRVINGMKYAAHWGQNMGKNSGITMLKDRVQKKPTGSILALAGLGLVVFGILNLARK